MTTAKNNPWILRSRPVPAPRLRLVCFPHAGGGAGIYRSWANDLPAEVEVCAIQLPGRETRLSETPFTRLGPLVEQLASAIDSVGDRPFVFFGFSMGALVGFELARLLRRRQRPLPGRLLVAARAAPQLPLRDPPIHAWPDAAFVAEVCRRYNGIPQPVLQEPELLQLLLPMLRADCAVIETYQYAAEEPLTIPITAFGGQDDTSVAPARLDAWREQTTREFRVETFPGGHFFLNTARSDLLNSIRAEVTSHL